MNGVQSGVNVMFRSLVLLTKTLFRSKRSLPVSILLSLGPITVFDRYVREQMTLFMSLFIPLPPPLPINAQMSSSENREVLSDEDCDICYQAVTPENERILPCRHRFCSPCIDTYAASLNGREVPCPKCRAIFQEAQMFEGVFRAGDQHPIFEVVHRQEGSTVYLRINMQNESIDTWVWRARRIYFDQNDKPREEGSLITSLLGMYERSLIEPVLVSRWLTFSVGLAELGRVDDNPFDQVAGSIAAEIGDAIDRYGTTLTGDHLLQAMRNLGLDLP
jgi:hypothetical protein